MARRLPMLGVSLALAAGLALPAQAQPPPVTAESFIAAAAGSDQYEVMAARVALVESRDPGLRAFAQEMVRDHTAALQALREAAARSGSKPPSDSLGRDQAEMLSALQGLRGKDFDQAYARQQALAHAQALVTEGGYARDGRDPALRSQATADAAMIQRHLAQAQALSRSHGG